LQLYYEHQGVKLPAPIEPVLLAADPGMHIQSMRPIVRVVMSDAIELFATSLLTARPVYNAQTAGEMVERLLNPHSANKQAESEAPAANDPFAVQDSTPFPSLEPSRMQSILNAPRSDALIETGQSDIGFAFDEADTRPPDPTVLVNNPREPRARISNRPNLILGMTATQIVVLAIMFVVWCAVMVGGFFLLQYIQSRP
jgi:hypothetical protein